MFLRLYESFVIIYFYFQFFGFSNSKEKTCPTKNKFVDTFDGYICQTLGFEPSKRMKPWYLTAKVTE